MKGLLVKDFRQLLQQKKPLIVIIFLAFILNLNMGGSFVFGYLTFIGSFLVLNTMSYDEYDNSLPFLFTLPVRRETYAVEKYVFGLCLCASGWLLALIMSLLQAAFDRELELDLILKSCPVYIPLVFFMLALMIPFPLIYGREKGSIMMMILVGIMVALGFLADHILEKKGLSLIAWLDSLSGFSMEMGTLLLFVTGGLVLGISCLVSTNYMKKKEF